MNYNAKKWVEALRSGDYAQTTSVLHNIHGYCCLGVACELYIKDGHDLGVDIDVEGTYRYNGSKNYLPIVVQEWLKLRRASGEMSDESLADHNDAGVSFSNIADIYTGEATTNLYILDKGEGGIFVIEKSSGNYLGLYKSGSLTQAEAIVVDEAKKTVYVLVSDSIRSFKLK
ncbi:hypothetical protein IH981_02400 [Patescibacteria group bacterium]|nr:hypothetical protein [Patescibacteria group bacterium]